METINLLTTIQNKIRWSCLLPPFKFMWSKTLNAMMLSFTDGVAFTSTLQQEGCRLISPRPFWIDFACSPCVCLASSHSPNFRIIGSLDNSKLCIGQYVSEDSLPVCVEPTMTQWLIRGVCSTRRRHLGSAPALLQLESRISEDRRWVGICPLTGLHCIIWTEFKIMF